MPCVLCVAHFLHSKECALCHKLCYTGSSWSSSEEDEPQESSDLEWMFAYGSCMFQNSLLVGIQVLLHVTAGYLGALACYCWVSKCSCAFQNSLLVGIQVLLHVTGGYLIALACYCWVFKCSCMLLLGIQVLLRIPELVTGGYQSALSFLTSASSLIAKPPMDAST